MLCSDGDDWRVGFGLVRAYVVTGRPDALFARAKAAGAATDAPQASPKSTPATWCVSAYSRTDVIFPSSTVKTAAQRLS